MDWTDPAVQFGCPQLNASLRAFCHSTTEEIWTQALEHLERLRASRVTIEYLRQVSSADIVSGKVAAAVERTSPVSVMTPLDEKATCKVKGYLRRRVEKLKATDTEEFRRLVPQNKELFEKGFDEFVEKCIDFGGCPKNSWFEEHVSSGAAQPQLWTIYVAFQRQLRDACEGQSRKPLPPPLFMTKQDDAIPVSAAAHHRHTLSQGCVAMPYAPIHDRHLSRSDLYDQRHYRTQSCQELGRPAWHVPYVLMPQYEGAPGYPWIVGSGIQDDMELPYVHRLPRVMLPVGSVMYNSGAVRF